MWFPAVVVLVKSSVNSTSPIKAGFPVGGGSLVLPMGNLDNDAPTTPTPAASDAGVDALVAHVKGPRRNGTKSPSRHSSGDSPPTTNKTKVLTAKQRQLLAQAKNMGDDTVAPLKRPDRSETKAAATRRQPLNGDEIRSTVGKNRTSIQRCYEREMRGAGGNDLRVELRITVQPSGVVSGVRVSPGNIRGTKLGTCVQNAARRWRFPTASAPSTFDVPFVLTPGRRH